MRRIRLEHGPKIDQRRRLDAAYLNEFEPSDREAAKLQFQALRVAREVRGREEALNERIRQIRIQTRLRLKKERDEHARIAAVI